MALLQIAEPGQYQAPHQHNIAAGIDLGTTHSLVASVRSGKVDVLPDENGNILLPSVIHFAPKQVLLGLEALEHATDDAENTIISVKRFMGRSGADINFKHPYTLTGNADEMPVFITKAGRKTPVEVSAEILYALKKRAEATLGGDLKGVVITVPAYFDDAQRQATKDAASLAGLNVLRMINEPTAAAIAYGLDRQQGNNNLSNNNYIPESHQVIFDLGGGTFDVSILRLNKGVFEVVATGGHTALGGDDIDRIIARWVLEQAGITDLALAEIHSLNLIARQAKETLSNHNETTIRFKHWHGVLNKVVFEALIQPVIDRCLSVCKRVLRDAKLQSTQIDEVVLVGGSTRIPAIAHSVGQLFAKTPLCHINPDHVVAMGAALLADQLVGNKLDGAVLLDVTPLSIGIETMGGLVEKIIPRNTALPISKQQEFTTYKDGQTAMLIHIVQGEREMVADCRSLGKFELRGIPPMTAGAARIKVTYALDADGLLTVSACETVSNIQSQLTVKPAYGLSDDDATRLLLEGYKFAENDKTQRALAEAKVEAERELLALEAALASDGAQLAATEQLQMSSAITALKAGLADAQLTSQTLDALTHQLKIYSDAFAANRMNRSVAKALTGTALKDW